MNALARRMARLERELEDATPPEAWGIIFRNLAGEVKYEGKVYPTEEAARAAAGRECLLIVEVDGRREVSA